METPKRLEQLTRDELVTLAQGLGVVKPRSLTLSELIAAVRAKEKSTARVEQPARAAPPSSPATPATPVAAAAEAAPAAGAGKAERQGPIPAVRVAASPRPFPEHELRHLDDAAPELPVSYEENRLALLPRDPWWLYAYWDLREDLRDAARMRGGRLLVLRLFEAGPRGKGRLIAEHEVQELARSWYLNVPSPRAAYCAELGMHTAQGEFLLLAASNVVTSPPAAPSEIIRDAFVRVPFEEDLRQMFGATPAGRSVPATANEPETLHEQMYQVAQGRKDGDGTVSRAVSSAAFAQLHEMGSASAASYVFGSEAMARGAARKDRSFWLVADAELIVFGATEPDATLTLGGRPLKLRPDGTFSVRFAFKDGEIATPIEAVAADGEQTRRIRMDFVRRTQA